MKRVREKLSSPRKLFLLISVAVVLGIYLLGSVSVKFYVLYLVALPVLFFGLKDMLQKRRAILRNFPLIGRLRYLLEAIRPEIMQYFIENNLDGRPINRETRSVVYQRAKSELQTLPFGTQKNVYEVGYEWVNHSQYPNEVDSKNLRVTIGGKECAKPYSSSILNISAMSFGSLSSNAILALNLGAKMGSFSHNTGEGGISQYHLKHGGDLVWQIGTGYFGTRTSDGKFCEKTFEEKSLYPSVKMIEIKISQGAKPGHGGILPGPKVTPEVAQVRGVDPWKNVISPPSHSAYSGTKGLLKFIERLRRLSEGKPVGIKMCVGSKEEISYLCKMMVDMKIAPDFITIDGAEGGTGAAPLEFANHLGMPLLEGLSFVDHELRRHGLRENICLIAAGKVFTAFDMVRLLAVGADVINSGRAMMLAIGCIHALRCNKNNCPAGVATNDPDLVVGLVPEDKSKRAFRFHKDTLIALAEIMGAMGIDEAHQISSESVYRRVSATQVKTFQEIYGDC